MASSKNFQQLMCWIKTLDGPTPVHTVELQLKEPFSIWGMTFMNSSAPMLSDVFDLSSWYKQWPTSRVPLATMDSRSEFISEISTFEKNVILVYLGYKPSGERLLVSSLNTDESYDFNQYPLLKLSRIVTINVNKAMKYNELIKFILGDIPLQNTVIVIKEWRGFGGGNRVNMQGSCSLEAGYSSLKPSASVMEDAEMYADKYLRGFGQYLSVSARFEMVTRAYSSMPNTQRRKKVDDAITTIMISVAKKR